MEHLNGERIMKRKIAVPFAVLLVCSLSLIGADKTAVKVPEGVRKFEFTYGATVRNLPSGNHLVRVWLPLATSDGSQTVTVKKISSPVPTRVTREAEYGNRMVFVEIRDPKSSDADFSIQYEVTRKEYSKGDFDRLMRYNHEPVRAPATVARFLEPDRLVPIDGKMKELAEDNTQGMRGAVAKAHALYDYVFHTLRYDKSGAGWGRGDSLWACDAKHGNCTDFHSLFISMMRAEKIPARFEIGFPLPADAPKGVIPGYHCWAEFYVDGAGWIPVDISEAWKNQSKHDYFFGTLDANRMQFTIGRDLTLAPKQDGPPLNYFVYPYVEVDGQPYDKLDKKFAFRENTVAANAAAGQ
jgi:transglutaminase-like putative cysteine protease